MCLCLVDYPLYWIFTLRMVEFYWQSRIEIGTLALVCRNFFIMMTMQGDENDDRVVPFRP